MADGSLPMMLMMGGGTSSLFEGMLDGLFDFGSDANVEEPEFDVASGEEEE